MTDIIALDDAPSRRVAGATSILGSGTYFDFEHPEETPLTIEDVAYGLAYACRFAGQTFSRRLNRRAFYGVADHCEIMSRQVPPHLAYDALMHELGEPTCGDIVGPLKAIIPEYKVVEKRCERAGFEHFGVVMREPEIIKHYDLRMLATERRDVTNWNGVDEWPWLQGAKPFDFQIIPRSPDEAAEAFLKRYHELKAAA